MRRKSKKPNSVKRYYIPLTLLMLAIVMVAIAVSSSTTHGRMVQQKIVVNDAGIELPAHGANDSLLINRVGRYTLQYSPHYRSAVWVAYKLTRRDTQGKVGRSASFQVDLELKKRGFEVAANSDYSKSGYDKGHLLPSADRQASAEENRATFVLSNCLPQLPALNRGTWKSLEEYLRKLSHEYDTLYVVTGAVLKPDNRRLGKNRVAVADHYFKAVLARRGDMFTPLGYIMPNQADIQRNIERYRVTVDSIERLTGLDLFPSIIIP